MLKRTPSPFRRKISIMQPRNEAWVFPPLNGKCSDAPRELLTHDTFCLEQDRMSTMSPIPNSEHGQKNCMAAHDKDSAARLREDSPLRVAAALVTRHCCTSEEASTRMDKSIPSNPFLAELQDLVKLLCSPTFVGIISRRKYFYYRRQDQQDKKGKDKLIPLSSSPNAKAQWKDHNVDEDQSSSSTKAPSSIDC